MFCDLTVVVVNAALSLSTTTKFIYFWQLKYISNNHCLLNSKANRGGRETSININF